jgi:hypothetical protein
MTKRTYVGSLAAALVASFPVAAAQASPNGDQYGNPVGHETTPTVVKTPSGARLPAATPQGSELPFTGLELGLIVAGGGAAAGTGFVLRRATRSRRS